MEIWNIPNTGRIEFELMKELGEDQLTVRDLLKTMILGLANRAREYYELSGRRDHVFINSEGELHASITPAIQQLTPIYKTEFPVIRQTSRSKRRGHLDYWIFNNNLSYAIEMKLAHKGIYRNEIGLSDSIFEKFNEALQQLQGVEEDTILHLMDGAKAIVKIVFETIVFDSNAQRVQNGFPDDLEQYRKKIKKQFEDLIRRGQHSRDKNLGFKAPIDFKALWLLDEDLIFLNPGREVKAFVYLAVGFIGHIDYIDLV